MGFDKTLPDKLTDSEKKKKKQENKAKANPAKAAENKASSDACSLINDQTFES